MKNLALAAVQYENTKGSTAWLPEQVRHLSIGTAPAAGIDPSEPTKHWASRPHVKVGTWAVGFLPWLDAQPTYEHWTQDRYPVIDRGPGESEPTGGYVS